MHSHFSFLMLLLLFYYYCTIIIIITIIITLLVVAVIVVAVAELAVLLSSSLLSLVVALMIYQNYFLYQPLFLSILYVSCCFTSMYFSTFKVTQLFELSLPSHLFLPRSQF